VAANSLGRVGIFSFENDLHALAVEASLRDRGLECFVFETSLGAPRRGVEWSTRAASEARLTSREGVRVSVQELDLIWWRRVSQTLRQPIDMSPATLDFLRNDWRHATEGAVFTNFSGIWLSDPAAQRRAENKIIQLQTAMSIGLHVPETIVTNSPTELRHFADRLGNDIIAKTLRGAATRATAAVSMTPEALSDDEAIALCPAIYQERVHGSVHLRAHVFGESVYAAQITTADLDWRRDLSVPFESIAVTPQLANQLVDFVSVMGLRMGVLDLKIDENDQVCFLEINPQGQFLFVEALAGLPLTEAICDYICAEVAGV
jgi:glutathione synthase/RimK-type ligase-like ATP-grasp enzyme